MSAFKVLGIERRGARRPATPIGHTAHPRPGYSQHLHVSRVAVGLALVAVLTGCGPEPSADPSTTPSATPTPTVEVAPRGEAAVPLGCSDLLPEADVADLGPDWDEDLSLAIHEDRIAVDMTVAELQRGTLRCIWAARYGSTDFHPVVELRVAPSTATEIVPPEVQFSAGPFAPLDDVASTLYSCTEGFQADESPALYNSCDVVQLRAGYRIDLATSGLKASAGQDSSVALQLLATIDGAIDAAGPARAIEQVIGSSDPASLCRAPEIAPALEYLGAEGEPTVESDVLATGVTSCRWPGVDAYGNPSGPWVDVLPGGAWAIPRMGTGVANIFTPTHPSADGSFVIGSGDNLGAWRAVGDDLVSIYGVNEAGRDGWESFLEATW